MSILIDRIQARLKETGLSARAASRRAGMSDDAIRNILNGKSAAPKMSTMRSLAQALDTTIPYLMGEIEHSPVRPNLTQGDSIDLPVMHTVAAGPWLSPDDYTDVEPEIMTVQAARGFEGIPQWLERVRGDSFNRLIGDGSYVHVADAIAMGYEPRTGDIVVVIRSRAQGALIERTLKEVEVEPGGHVRLWPRSYNPRWSEPISVVDGLGDHENEVEVRIVGRVLRAISDFTDRSRLGG